MNKTTMLAASSIAALGTVMLLNQSHRRKQPKHNADLIKKKKRKASKNARKKNR